MIKHKLVLISAASLLCLTMGACGNQNNDASQSASESREASSLKKDNSKLKRQNKKKQSSSSSTSSGSSQNSQTTQSSAQQSSQTSNRQQNTNSVKSQSEINRERGYDPNGNPLLPGQDHAAGSNPDGSPDAWVQGQIDWAIQNGYMNPDGTNTPKGQAAEDEVERDSQPGMP